MHIKYLPFAVADIDEAAPGVIAALDENTVRVDDDVWRFDASVEFPDVATQTGHKIYKAYRVDGVLYVEVVRRYTGPQPAWDTGEYHVVAAYEPDTGLPVVLLKGQSAAQLAAIRTEHAIEALRAEQERRIEAVRWRLEREAEQRELGITPQDSRAALLAYRQAIREVNNQPGAPFSVVWPDEVGGN